jgi:hypothetical protein
MLPGAISNVLCHSAELSHPPVLVDVKGVELVSAVLRVKLCDLRAPNVIQVLCLSQPFTECPVSSVLCFSSLNNLSIPCWVGLLS